MERTSIAPDRRSFERSGRPWFYLADTAWSGVTNPADDEWERYLDHRAEQGFTAIQINLLPQWDRSLSPLAVHPFARSSQGYDFTAPASEYFAAASNRLAAVADRGMVPAVVLLWCNYVPDTWASARRPEDVIPEEALDGYLRLAVRCARDHAPVYLVSGDTDFPSPRSIAYYRTGLRIVKDLDPDGLTTLHIKGALHEIPDELLTADELDFYSFQSGHGKDHWDTAGALARVFREKRPARPIINSEPCYEGIGVGQSGGRFTAKQVRLAAWQAVLGGANAGVAYGAHGIWSWHRPGLGFGSAGFWGAPFAWEDALRFEGADDYAFLRRLALDLIPQGLEPMEADALPPSACAGRTPDGTVLIYLPDACDLPLVDELGGLSWTRWDLESRTPLTVRIVETEGTRLLWKGCRNGDSLLVGKPS